MGIMEVQAEPVAQPEDGPGEPRDSVGLQRVRGSGRLRAAETAGTTRLEALHESGAAKIRLPRRDNHALEAVLINTAGGLTGGDRLEWNVTAAAGAVVTATTPACEKIYRAGDGQAHVTVTLDAGRAARLAWLPQETILFDGAALSRRLEADIAPDARLLIAEALLFGRKARGEAVRTLQFRDRWRIRCGGRLIHGEDQRLDGDAQAVLNRPVVAGGAAAVATVLLVGPGAVERIETVRGLLAERGQGASAASTWTVAGTGKLLARLTAADGYALRKALVPLLELLNDGAGLPKNWSI